MGSDSTSRTLLLLTALAVSAWLVWLVRDVLPPFLISLCLALLLDPVLDRLQRWGLPRWLAVALTYLAVLAAFFGVLAFLVPQAVGQVAELVRNLPEYGARLQEGAERWVRENSALLERLHLPVTLGELWQQYQRDITAAAQVVLQNLFRSLQSGVGLLAWIVVIPVVTLYLLLDIDRLKGRIRHVIPPAHRAIVEQLAGEVGQVFLAYLRGLVLVSFSYGLCVYLTLQFGFRLQYAVILGIAAVVLYAIPYLGQIAVIGTSLLVAALTGGGSPAWVVGVGLSLVAVGQLFDQLITPRVMGKQVGLHPVLGLFALMVGGQLFGLGGMVVAVPVAASVRILLIHLFPRLAEPLPGEPVSRGRSLFGRRPVAGSESPPEPEPARDSTPGG